jgi:hypothetical protein
VLGWHRIIRKCFCKHFKHVCTVFVFHLYCKRNALFCCLQLINPLTPDLNAPEQQRPAEVFKCGFLFLTLTLRKKSYLIHLCIKFEEIKFRSVFMNCLIREKMFTYFYNKFRPVNCMHYIKSSVNILLHISCCCRRSVAPWITILSQQIILVFYTFTFV